MLKKLLPELSEVERDVLCARLGLDGEPPRTLIVIGQGLGRTKERIRQIQNKGLAKLRLLIESAALAEESTKMSRY